MAYYILKTRETTNSPRIFYLLKNSSIPEDERSTVLHLGCNSIRKFTGVSGLMEYLDQNTSNDHHIIEPYILKKITWNMAIDMFGLDFNSDTEYTYDSDN